MVVVYRAAALLLKSAVALCEKLILVQITTCSVEMTQMPCADLPFFSRLV